MILLQFYFKIYGAIFQNYADSQDLVTKPTSNLFFW